MPWKKTPKAVIWQYDMQECKRFTKSVQKYGQRFGAKHVTMTAKRLRSYDFIVCSSSGGKDSLACLARVISEAKKARVLDKVMVLHCDLGQVEWPGAPELAERQADHFGVPFRICSRIGEPASGVYKPPNKRAWYKQREPWGDLLTTVERRYLQLKAKNQHKKVSPWPDDRNRYCTGEYKGNAAKQFYMELSFEVAQQTGIWRPLRILDCWGIRAEESPARAQKSAFDPEHFMPTERTLSTRAKRQGMTDLYLCEVDTWLPVFCDDRSTINKAINRSKAPTHYAYDVGMQRLSCPFCFYAGMDAWQIAAYYNPKLAEEYIKMERRVGWPTKKDRSVAEAVREFNKTGIPPKVSAWYTGNCPGTRQYKPNSGYNPFGITWSTN